MTDNPMSAAFTDDLDVLFITDRTVIDGDVAREARRWTSYERGPLVNDEGALTSGDLTQVGQAPASLVDGWAVGTGPYAFRTRPERSDR